MTIDKKAVDFVAKKRKQATYKWSELMHNEHGAVFSVAKSTEADILLDVKTALQDALKQGKTLRQFKKELTPTLQEKGWWGKKEAVNPKTGQKELVQLGSSRRLDTIYDVNKRSARAAATWERAQETKDFAPYFVYKLGPSVKHRDEHLKWAGTVLPVDHPFWDYAFPPNGWGCKCTVEQVTKNRAEKLGGVSKPPKEEFLEKNIGGKQVKYLKGVDPAWSSNSGKFRNKVLSESLEQKLLKAPEKMAKSQISSIVASKYFTSFFNKAKKIQPEVKHIRDKLYNFVPLSYVKKGAVSKPHILRLSEETVANKKLVHPDIGAAEYSLVQEIVGSGFYNKKQGVYYKKIKGKWYLVSVKLTKKNELIMNSFYRVTEEQVRKLNK